MTPPAPPRRARQMPGMRRQDLLHVTIECLAELGPRGTTGREVCRRAGVSHGLLRHYFTDPQNLLLETYEDLCERFLASLQSALSVPGPDPVAALDRFFAVLFSHEWANAAYLGAWAAFWALVRTDPAFAAVSEAFNARLRARLFEAVARLRPVAGLSHADVATILSATMDGLWLDHCLSPERLPRARAEALCGLTLRQLVVTAEGDGR